MEWPREIAFDRPRLQPRASLQTVREVEQQLDIRPPEDHVQFLLTHDGGDICNKRYAIYSAGANRYADNTLLAANADMPSEYPLVNIGFGPNEEFGFRKSDLPAAECPVYTIFHETWELRKLAPSFREFLLSISAEAP